VLKSFAVGRVKFSRDRFAVETSAIVIPRSYVVSRPITLSPYLPAGFDDGDLAILRWIIADGTRDRQWRLA
jgi:hypothetical protein